MRFQLMPFSALWWVSAMGTGEGFQPQARTNSLLNPSLRMAETNGESQSHSRPIQPMYEAKTSSSFDKYVKIHKESIDSPSKYWGNLAKDVLTWDVPFDSHRVLQGGFEKGDVRWFAGGKLNVAYNALDRHDPDALAIIWEGDEPSDVRKITFGEMTSKVSQIANALKAQGVKKGDVVTIYMPMIPELAMTMVGIKFK
jgi:acetyl-CoA synthetase